MNISRSCLLRARDVTRAKHSELHATCGSEGDVQHLSASVTWNQETGPPVVSIDTGLTEGVVINRARRRVIRISNPFDVPMLYHILCKWVSTCSITTEPHVGALLRLTRRASSATRRTGLAIEDMAWCHMLPYGGCNGRAVTSGAP